jgi:hypothetical protein
MPGLSKLIVLLVVALLLGAVAVLLLMPARIIGVTEGPLARSLADERPQLGGALECDRRGEGRFVCARLTEAGRARPIRVVVDGECWTATMPSGSGRGEASGCVKLDDYLTNPF